MIQPLIQEAMYLAKAVNWIENSDAGVCMVGFFFPFFFFWIDRDASGADS